MTQGALTAINVPVGWSWKRLWAAAPRVQEVGQPDAEPLSVFLLAGVVPRSSREDNHNQLGEDMSKYQVVQPGDLVFNKLRTWQGGLGVSAYHGIVSPAYFVCRPVNDWHPRYLHYLLLSSPYLSELTRLSKFMPPSQFDIPWDMLRALPLLRPPLEEQRRIADFLDAETARIECLIDAQQSAIELLDERRKRILEDVLIPANAASIPLGYVTEYGRPIMYGIVLPGPNVEEGVPIVKGGDVAARRLSLSQLNKTTYEIEANYTRSRLKGGDLVIAIRGSVGEVARVPDEIAGANLTQDAARIAPGPNIEASWLELILETPSLQEQIGGRITGATVKGINIWDLRRVVIPQISLDQQSQAVRAVEGVLTVMDSFVSSAKRQIVLLAERRRTLITAAVTGGITV